MIATRRAEPSRALFQEGGAATAYVWNVAAFGRVHRSAVGSVLFWSSWWKTPGPT